MKVRVGSRDVWVLETTETAPLDVSVENRVRVSDRLRPEEAVEFLIQSRENHIIQTEPSLLTKQVTASAALMDGGDAFFSDPLGVVLGAKPESFVQVQFKTQSEKAETIKKITQFLDTLNGAAVIRESVIRIADEFYSNAMNHTSDGGTLSVGCAQGWLSIGCVDSLGALSPRGALTRILRCYQKGPGNSMRLLSAGAGMGFFTLYELCTSLFIAVKPGKQTAVFCELPLSTSFKQNSVAKKSIHLSFDGDPTLEDKQMKTLNIRKIETKGSAVFEIEGAIDEDANFSEHSLGQYSAVQIDLNQVHALNSCGIREWVRWMQTAAAGAQVSFTRCPKVVVDQMNMVEGFLPKSARVDSFSVPYYCEVCEKLTYALFTRGVDFDQTGCKPRPALACENCKKTMELDVVETKYFKFLKIPGG